MTNKKKLKILYFTLIIISIVSIIININAANFSATHPWLVTILLCVNLLYNLETN